MRSMIDDRTDDELRAVVGAGGGGSSEPTDVFAAELAHLAGRLHAAAATAGRRSLYGLQDALSEASDSARSWAGITLDGTVVYHRPDVGA